MKFALTLGSLKSYSSRILFNACPDEVSFMFVREIILFCTDVRLWFSSSDHELSVYLTLIAERFSPTNVELSIIME